MTLHSRVEYNEKKRKLGDFHIAANSHALMGRFTNSVLSSYESKISDNELNSLVEGEIKNLEWKIVDKKTKKVIYEVKKGDVKIFANGEKSEIVQLTRGRWGDDWVGDKKVGHEQCYYIGEYNFSDLPEDADPQLIVTFETKRVLPLSTYKIYIINGTI